MKKRFSIQLLLLASLNIVSASADTLQIQAIPHPELIEVEAAKGGEYRLVSELGKLTYPLAAKSVEGNRLEFRQGAAAWKVSRADVELVNEKLVVDACSTIPVTLAGDAKSASVKGAGEGCK
ncbi:hypothetical protein D3C76_573560 [compost metagenome]|uniref:hypothetical protein n=1 Tax=Pseudomonas TaxID=286 RepID=UPI000F9CC09B|nr:MULTISPECIES: hypothetical protein [Pseudomonas]QHF36843.1 hypothetical protein PspS34_00780 [Pseudomonas sp. S34]VVP15314.1 hypothetical protein PS893_03550 [Pseudomonas fluorescens]